MVAEQLEKVRRQKQNQNWRDVWIQDLERERVDYLRQKNKGERSCPDMKADKSGDIEEIGQSVVLAQDDNDAMDMSDKQNETKQNDEKVEIPKSRQEDFGRRDNLTIQMESSRKRKRSQKSALNKLINDTIKVGENSTSAALMENLTECSALIKNGSGYESSQKLQISESQVNNQYESSEELQISESQVNNQYESSEELQISESQVNNQYESSEELQISETQVNNQYKPSQIQEYPASIQGYLNFRFQSLELTSLFCNINH